MNTPPLITVAILNYNGLNLLKQNIPFILDLTYPNKEIIVLDNNSRDKSTAYLKTIKTITTLENKKNTGLSKGKNLLVKDAHGEFILLIDNDIQLPDKNLIQNLLDFYTTKQKISFLSIPLLNPDSSVTEHYGMYFSTIKRNLSITKIKKQNYFQTGGFIGGLTFFKKDIFIELNGFDEKYPFCIDDYDLSARAYLRGYKIYTLTNCVAYHIKEKNLSRESTLKKLAWKRKYEFCGFTRMLLKNYRLKNIIIWFPLAAGWIFIKALKLSMRYRTFKPLLSYAKSVVYFLFDFKDTIYQRRIIQSKRTVKEDLFLKINPPR